MFPIRDHNPSGRTPYVTYSLIAINIAVFLAYWYGLQSENALNEFFYTYGLVPRIVMSGHNLPSLLTHMFMHGGWMHLAGNMLFLWIFGDNLEDLMGHAKFLMFYIVAGLAAAALQIAVDPTSLAPMVGASGAIAGVLGGYLLLFPRARVDVVIILIIIFKVFTIRAWLMLCLWFGAQLFSGFSTPSQDGGVAYFAHIGGFIAGLVLCFPLWRSLGGTEFWQENRGKPAHPPAEYQIGKSRIPSVVRRKL
jgi:membrane associated rhomboid family serine protease